MRPPLALTGQRTRRGRGTYTAAHSLDCLKTFAVPKYLPISSGGLPMKRMLGISLLFGTVVATIGAIQAAEQQQQPLQKPEWAYGIPPARAPGEPAPPPVRDDGKMFSVPGAD